MNNILEQLQATIIGTMIQFPAEIDTAASLLKPEDFSRPLYSDIFSFVVEKGGADYILIAKQFGKKYSMAEVTAWAEDIYMPSFLKKHCLELKELNRKEQLYRSLSEVRQSFESKSSHEIIELINAKLSEMAGGKIKDPTGAKTLVKEMVTRIEKRYEHKGEITGIPYGWAELDKMTNGLHTGDLVVIAGRPSMGKSALALNIAENVCEIGKGTLLFSLEMTKEQCSERIMASRGRINYGAIRSGLLQGPDWPKMESASAAMFGYNLAIDDTPAITLHDVRCKARAMKQQHGLHLIIIDYLQLMGMNQKLNLVQAIGEVTRGLKQLAKELNLTVVLLSQLSRGVDSRTDKRPVMSDLRDSGEIEQDADVILFPYRPAAYCEKCRDKVEDADHNYEEHQSVAELIIEKQRNGDRNIKIKMAWLGRFQKFAGIER